ncbi:hypothetical protein DPZ15_28430, partial [Klebsiella pneumoniae]|uniref:hypothetical protein n=1 Tax=Klebsiella pneumoniae TaxID=573 RepID=UPI000EF087D9
IHKGIYMNSNTTIALHFSLVLLFTLLSVAGSNHDLAGVVSQLFFIFMAAFYFFRAMRAFLNIINVIDSCRR